MLTIVIPFYNEDWRVEFTVKSVRDTTVTNPKIILINDGSKDKYDYKAVADKYNCKYVEHDGKWGVGASRQHGSLLVDTEFIMFLDAHMVLYEQGWDERIIKIARERPGDLIFSQSQVVTEDLVNVKQKPCSYGATIDFENYLKTVWTNCDHSPKENIMAVECPLGAAYLMAKKDYDYIHGLQGLLGFGYDEQLLAVKLKYLKRKAWLVKDWVTGHWYRKANACPHTITREHNRYNALFVLDICKPYLYEAQYRRALDSINKQWAGEDTKNLVNAWRAEREDWLNKELNYLHNIF